MLYLFNNEHSFRFIAFGLFGVLEISVDYYSSVRPSAVGRGRRPSVPETLNLTPLFPGSDEKLTGTEEEKRCGPHLQPSVPGR